MPKEKNNLPIRSALIPVFYQKFHCLAQECRDSCCVGWEIFFDKKDYLRLHRLDAPPALRERLEQGVRRMENERRSNRIYGQFDLESNNGRCPFLDEDGLCAIQRACGHSALPHVCTFFPRKAFLTPTAKEHALSPACEGVLQLLWDLPEGVEFVEDPLPKADQRTITIPQNENLYLYFTPVRDVFIDILQNRAMSLTERMLCLGVMVQRLQKADWENFDLDGWERHAALLAEPDVASKLDIPGNRDMYLVQNVGVLSMISAAKIKWPDEIFNALEAKQDLTFRVAENVPIRQNSQTKVFFSKEAYADSLTRFQAAFSDHEYFFENLMVTVALHQAFPRLSSKEDLWKSYVNLCNLYSFYRFVSVLSCKDEATKARLFHMIAMASRAMLHSRNRLEGLQKLMSEHDSSTLAHLAILLRWD